MNPISLRRERSLGLSSILIQIRITCPVRNFRLPILGTRNMRSSKRSWNIGTSSRSSPIGQKWQKPKVESTPSTKTRDSEQITVENRRYHKRSRQPDYLRYGEWLLKNSFMLEPAEIKSRWDAL